MGASLRGELLNALVADEEGVSTPRRSCRLTRWSVVASY